MPLVNVAERRAAAEWPGWANRCRGRCRCADFWRFSRPITCWACVRRSDLPDCRRHRWCRRRRAGTPDHRIHDPRCRLLCPKQSEVRAVGAPPARHRSLGDELPIRSRHAQTSEGRRRVDDGRRRRVPSAGLVLDNNALRLGIVAAGVVGTWYIIRRVPTSPAATAAPSTGITSDAAP